MSVVLDISDEKIFSYYLILLVCTQLVIKYFSSIEETMRDTDPRLPQSNRMFIEQGSLLLTCLRCAILLMLVFMGFKLIVSYVFSPKPSFRTTTPNIVAAAPQRRIPLKSFFVPG
jgi:hypothetical protein